MKQHITLEQCNELSEEQKQNLRDLYMFVDDYRHTPQPNIGQMIEILSKFAQEHWYENLYICTEHYSRKSGGYDWLWCVRHGNIEFEAKELCDALWEAIKAVL